MRPDDALLSDLRVIEGIKGDRDKGRDKGDATLFRREQKMEAPPFS